MRRSNWFLAGAAVAAILFLLTSTADAGAKRGFAGVGPRMVKCADGGVKDSEVYVTNATMGTVTFEAKVASPNGVGDPRTYTLQPMGMRVFDCNDIRSLYPGGNSFRRGVLMIISDDDVRISSLFIAKSKNMPVPIPDTQLEPAG